MSLEPKLRSWRFPRYWQFNKRYHSGYQLICLISRPILISSRCDWYLSKGLFKGFLQPLRPWESSKNWWRYEDLNVCTWTSLITHRQSFVLFLEQRTASIQLSYHYFKYKGTTICRTIDSNQVIIYTSAQTITFLYIRTHSLRIRPQT